MRSRLEKRFTFLYTGEAAAMVVFIFVSFLWHLSFPGLGLFYLFSFWVSFLLLLFLLMQGSYYWYSKRRRLKKEGTSITPDRVVQYLWRMKRWNVIWIWIAPLSFFIDVYIWYPSLPLGMAIALFIYIFSILEYINYFHLQLSYDNVSDIKYLAKTRRLKQACISKDFVRKRLNR
ncbi:general stress protein [Anaerobacillus alkaliphilus]|uniref:General stress protein n=1 Tax=Anaerobacillus alkaliphilus TaxID=1548597 RepID=A0A4Q0VYB4_9BACI|nr:general stress protein [Anaerobacillus alkaliphilus]RXJ04402.1 general stress protein [Anaerobacillus alkaliphilus]